MSELKCYECKYTPTEQSRDNSSLTIESSNKNGPRLKVICKMFNHRSLTVNFRALTYEVKAILNRTDNGDIFIRNQEAAKNASLKLLETSPNQVLLELKFRGYKQECIYVFEFIINDVNSFMRQIHPEDFFYPPSCWSRTQDLEQQVYRSIAHYVATSSGLVKTFISTPRHCVDYPLS